MSTPAPATISPVPRSPWLNAIVANIQDAVIVLDAAGQVVFESPSACRILGISPDQVLRVFGLERIHPEERDTVIRSLERTIAVPGSVARGTYRFQRVDGSWQHLEAIAKNLLDDPEIRGVLVTFRDVTDRIRALEAAERAGLARDEFLSQMSHELRTPLHAILGWAQLLQARQDEGMREAAEQIEGAGHHLLHLVEEALDLVAVREGRISMDLRMVDLTAVAGEAIELVRPLARRRDIDIHTLYGVPEGTTVLADPRRLRQVFINLLSNAVKFNRHAGEVLVGWTPEGDERVRISIRDTGPGMPEEQLDRVFDRFERLALDSAKVEGSGLGLAITRGLVEMMGGTIGVESRPGTGAEFWVRLAAK